MATRCVDLFSDHGLALQATASFALRNVAALVDANFCRSGIEVGLKHVKSALVLLEPRWCAFSKELNSRFNGEFNCSQFNCPQYIGKVA